MDLVDLNGRFPSLKDVKDFWNKYIYGKEYITSKTTSSVTGRESGIGTYHSTNAKKITTSDTYTGNIIKNVITMGDSATEKSYSINIHSFDLGDGNRFGSSASLGVTFGTDGFSINANPGIDLAKGNINIPLDIGFNWEDFISIDTGLNFGWNNNSGGLDIGIGAGPGSNLKIGMHNTTRNAENETLTNKDGLYMRMVYVYAVVISAVGLVEFFYGNSPSAAWQNIQIFVNNYIVNGKCPGM